MRVEGTDRLLEAITTYNQGFVSDIDASLFRNPWIVGRAYSVPWRFRRVPHVENIDNLCSFEIIFGLNL